MVLYSKIALSKKFNNIDLDRDSTGPLEHTFGGSIKYFIRVKCKNIHTIEKFTKTVGEINRNTLRRQQTITITQWIFVLNTAERITYEILNSSKKEIYATFSKKIDT